MRKTHALFFCALMIFGFAARAQNLESELAVQILLHDLPLSTDDGLPTVESQTQALDDKTDQVDVQLTPMSLAPIHLILRGPTGFYDSFDNNLNTLFVVSGFPTGATNGPLFQARTDAVIVDFQYPFGVMDFVADADNVRQFARQTPAQILLAIQWLQMQGWLRDQGLTVMGIGLGGIVLPVSLHMAQDSGVQVPRVIFGFTGADLASILSANLQGSIPAPLLQPLVQTMVGLMTLDDPRLHLPALKGNFLVLRADNDQVIPADSTQSLFDSLAGSKNEIVLSGPHLDVDQPDMIAQTQNAVWSWLSQQP